MSEEKIESTGLIGLSPVVQEIPEDLLTFNDPVYGQRFLVREGVGYKEVTKPSPVPIRVHRDRSYTVSERDSFVRYVKKYGDLNEGIIIYNDAGVTMFFNEANREETVHLPFKPSLELRTFLGSTGKGNTFDQKALVKAIETFPESVTGFAILAANLTRLKVQTIKDFESDISPDNYTFLYQEKGGNQTAQLPKEITLAIPYFERGRDVEIKVDLEIQIPKSAEEKVMFTLTDPRYERTKRDALDLEIASIEEELPDWMFVQGTVR